MTARVAAFLIAIAAGACGTQDVHVQDHGIWMPTLRVDVPSVARAAVLDDTRVVNGLALEVTGGGGSFAGGSADYDLLEVQGVAYLRAGYGQPLSGSVFLGLDYLELWIDAAGTDDTVGFGGVVGAEAAWTFAPPVSLYGRVSGAALLLANTSSRAEVGIQADASSAVQLFAGYRWWRVRVEDIVGSNDLDLHTDGIVFGLQLTF